MDTVKGGEGGKDIKFANSKFHVGSLKLGTQRSEVVEVSKPEPSFESDKCEIMIRHLNKDAEKGVG